MNDADDSKLKILSESNINLKDLFVYVSIKKGLFNKDQKHELLVRAKQRSKELNCSVKILILAVQFVQRDISLRAN